MTLRIALVWLAAIMGIVGVVAIAGVNLTTSPAEAATRLLEENASDISSRFASSITSGSSLIITNEIFEKDGNILADGENSSVVYPNTIISKTTLTPGNEGQLTKMESQVSDKEGNVLVRSTADEVNGFKHHYTSSGDSWKETRRSGDNLSATNLVDWLDVQLDIISVIKQQGYDYVGESTLFGRPSVRYKAQRTLRELPDGTQIEPVELLTVLEFVVANPLLKQESHYRRPPNGRLELKSRTTWTEFTTKAPTQDAGSE